MNDLRFATRVLVKSPGFTTISVMTLALAIGGNTAMFTLVNSVLLRPLPYRDPGRLVAIDDVFTNRSGQEMFRAWSYPRFEDFRKLSSSFENIAGYASNAANLTGTSNPERLKIEIVSARYFRVLGEEVAVGRTFSDDEDRTPGANPVVMVSHALWQRRFGSDPSIVGRTIRLNEIALTVIGVLPEDFRGLAPSTDVWVPMMMAPTLFDNPTRLANAQSYWMHAVGRLRKDVTLDQASAAAQAANREIEKAHPAPSAMHASVGLQSLLATKIDPSLRRSLMVLFGAVGFVLLMACANLSNLLLGRNSARRQEVAIRIALGASRGALIRQFLTQNLLLAIAGGVLGLLVAHWGVDLAASLRPEAMRGGWATYARSIDRDALKLDVWVIAFNLLASVLTGLIFGVLPALEISRANPGIRSSSLRSARSRATLIIVEVALALVLLAGAAMMIGSFSRLIHVPVGFSAVHVATAHIELPGKRYKPEQVVQFMSRLTQNLAASPELEIAGIGNSLPVTGQAEATVAGVEHQEPALGVGVHVVSPGFFTALRIPLRQGRYLTDADRIGAPNVVLINETASRRLFPGENPVGKRINLDSGWGPTGDLKEIVGVLGDVEYDSIESPVGPDVYASALQYPYELTYIVARTSGDPARAFAAIRGAVMKLDRDLPVTSLLTMDSRLDAASSRIRFVADLLGVFAAMAMLLAAIGIYGVVSYSVAARTREIGVRMALGASPAMVLREIAFDGLLLAGIGVAIGWPLARWATRALAALLYGVHPGDPWFLTGASMAIVVIAVTASAVPAIRAAKVDPLIALRYE